MRFVVVVDMQRDFVASDGALLVAGAEEMVAPMNAWLASLQPAEVAGVLFTADTHVPEVYALSEEAKQFPPHCEVGTPGWALVVDPNVVDAAIPTYRLEKGVFDMWAEPGLVVERIGTADTTDREAFFNGLQAQGVEHVEVVGVAADYCVRWAVEGLLARGFRVTVPVGLTRGIVRQIDMVALEEWTGRNLAIA
ncbi:cysteine hydrolase family protein [Sphingomonas sp. SORGH_AS_0879]|uniref:cysteine hydrolase family protein n=1 Tax=Sphingomonas sp. SORGH_AS_0879 TaxID=3041790 RepID=UPI00277F09D0|nr:isochorismatase family protein [Sphingomonas sp. SORGH_AS_0879]MDQ1231125.1 nicotinamidase/pyrazinamidase [Sphingomonas sp. SORGH_AS_0879]